MRIRNVFITSVGICGSVLFFACGDNSFDGTATADGGTDATTTDGTPGADANSDAATGPDAVVQSDGGVGCSAQAIIPLDAGLIDCPGFPGEVGEKCSAATGPCCFADGIGTCSETPSCAGDSLEWACAKSSDCAGSGTACCLTATAGPSTGCIDTAALTGSTCNNTGICAGSAQMMCVHDRDCTNGTTHCKPLFVRFDANVDAGVVVGACIP